MDVLQVCSAGHILGFYCHQDTRIRGFPRIGSWILDRWTVGPLDSVGSPWFSKDMVGVMVRMCIGCFLLPSCVVAACVQQHKAAVHRVTESMATATQCRRSFSRGGQAPAGQTMRLLRACIMFLAISGFSSSFKPAFIKATRPVSKALQATTTPVIDSDAEAFERITLARRSTKHFERRAVPDELLKKVLALVMRSPSGFNAQPYECVVVTSEEAKKKLSRAMLGANRERVLEAGATVVFASDLNSMKNVKKLTKLLGEEGWPEGFISKVPLYLSVFSTGHKRFFRLPLVVIKKASFAVVQRLGKGMPTVAGAETWAFKNTMLAVQELLLAATSHGLASCPMEGFDMRRLRKALRIPLRYSIPIVVCIGYPSEEQRDFKTLRFDPGEVFHRDEFGTTLEGIPSL